MIEGQSELIGSTDFIEQVPGGISQGDGGGGCVEQVPVGDGFPGGVTRGDGGTKI